VIPDTATAAAGKLFKIPVSTLIVVYTATPSVLLIERADFAGHWQSVTGSQEPRESLAETATRELLEETNVGNVYLEQLFTFGDKGRDPRGRVVTVSYLALLRQDDLKLRASSDASGVAWWPVMDLPKLAFDHQRIIEYAHQRIKYKIEYSAAAFSLLPAKFTLRDLQSIYEAVLGRPIDNRNFRKRFLKSGILQELDETSQQGSFRPARLYSFGEQEFEQLPDRPVFSF